MTLTTHAKVVAMVRGKLIMNIASITMMVLLDMIPDGLNTITSIGISYLILLFLRAAHIITVGIGIIIGTTFTGTPTPPQYPALHLTDAYACSNPANSQPGRWTTAEIAPAEITVCAMPPPVGFALRAHPAPTDSVTAAAARAHTHRAQVQAAILVNQVRTVRGAEIAYIQTNSNVQLESGLTSRVCHLPTSASHVPKASGRRRPRTASRLVAYFPCWFRLHRCCDVLGGHLILEQMRRYTKSPM